MFHLDILHKRNNFMFFSYVFSFFLYHSMIFANMFQESYATYNYLTVVAIAFNAYFLYQKINPKIQMWLLILSWNISIVTVIISSEKIITFYWFIFLILFVMIYQSKLVNLIVSLVCVLEVLIIFSFKYSQVMQGLESDFTLHIYFLILLLLTGIMQITYIRYYWNKTEKSTIEREIELSSTEGYLNLFFEQAEDAIAVFDMEDKIITVNPAFERLYGWTKEESVGKSLPLVPPIHQQAANERAERIFAGEKMRLIETQDMKKDGTYFDAQISLSPIYDRHGEMIAVSVISRDISYIKKNEQLLLQSEKLKLAGEIAAGVAHEIRNPLTVISGFIQMMNADENSPYKSYTELIHSEINRIEQIIDEFLVLSKPEVSNVENIEITKLLHDIQHFFSLVFEERNIHFQINFNETDVTIKGNLNQIKQVFINLIKNAVEGINEDGDITIELWTKDDKLYISVKDNGIGIPNDVLKRIFEPFYTTKSKGTGLGMMITKKIVNAHHGDIEVRSKVNCGTEIILHFPISKSGQVEKPL